MSRKKLEHGSYTTVSFRISLTLAIKIRAVAAGQNKSRSQVLREAVVLWLDAQAAQDESAKLAWDEYEH